MTLKKVRPTILQFLLDRVNESYPQPNTELHSSISDGMIQDLLCDFKKGTKVLDVGCGQGVALETFKKKGFDAVGIGVNKEDLLVCKKKGFFVRWMDQTSLQFPEEYFDVVWCRHCLEHSVIPYYTLAGFSDVLKKDGFLYVEVPAPDTTCKHQENRNHYSVFGASMWIELITRAGFKLLNYSTIDIGRLNDTYFAFSARKA